MRCCPPALMDITAATMVGIPAASPAMANIIIAAPSRFSDTADPFPMVIAPAPGECSDEPSVARTDLRGQCDELTCWNPTAALASGWWINGRGPHRAFIRQPLLWRLLQQGFIRNRPLEKRAPPFLLVASG